MKKIVILFSVLIWMAGVFSCKTQTTQSVEDTRPRLTFDDFYVKYSLRQIDGLYPIPLDSLPWAESVNNLPQNGQMCYFFLDPTDIALSSAHIRGEYLASSLPWCSTRDSLFLWLKGIYINPERNGTLLFENEIVPTATPNLEAGLMAISVPSVQKNDSTLSNARWMTWAYIPAKGYWAGFVFTAFDQVRFEEGLERFRELLGTFEEIR